MGVKENLERVRAGIAGAAKGRQVKLVVVTKYVGRRQVEELVGLGVDAVGENRLQDAEEKLAGLKVEKHFIGRIQSNKIREIAELFGVVESLCDLKHAKKLSEECVRLGKTMPVFVQVNVGEEEQKQGVKPGEEEVKRFVEAVKAMPGVTCVGLMAIPPLGADSAPYFKKMKFLFDSLRDDFSLLYLSMGMSDDYVKAIKSGANVVRVGRAVFA